ncbi:unnamed protein product [Protopolystoma xenopodis]|uniref:Sodium/hydrogen exchanger n=1 Tax=Protopolystoma xenopodis TaxID=117903 RepID=A0A3S5CBI9_9PLAT|nr:unnamed protein product [Protopolystoma xenopodis]
METAIGNNSDAHHELILVAWRFKEFSIYVTVMLFLSIVIVLRIFFHRIPLLSTYLPESLILIAVGAVFGAIIRFTELEIRHPSTWQLSPKLFFEILLPPIVLKSAYELHNRVFCEFLGVIIIFAVVGTILNFLIIGPCMFLLQNIGAMGSPALGVDIKDCLLFSSLIIAVDPVAVIAIFQDIGVDLGLFYMVFGESLLNDAITVVLYQIMKVFVTKEEVAAPEIVIAFVSFFTVSLGGLCIGIVFGVLTCLITRFPSSMEVIVVIMMGYFSYIMGDTVGWSGIISMVGCGLVQASYAFHNLQPSSVMIVKRVTQILAELSETIIFLFLGVELYRDDLVWHSGFVLWSLVMSLLTRLLVTPLLTLLINLTRETPISWTEQLILVYGGVRGAVSFSLAMLIEASSLADGEQGARIRGVFITATLFVILFGLFINGVTLKPMIRLLKIRLQVEPDGSMFNQLNLEAIDYLQAGAEIIAGVCGQRSLARFWEHRVNERYLRRFLQRWPHVHARNRLVKAYQIELIRQHLILRPVDKTTSRVSVPNLYTIFTSSASTNGVLERCSTSGIGSGNRHSSLIQNELQAWLETEITQAHMSYSKRAGGQRPPEDSGHGALSRTVNPSDPQNLRGSSNPAFYPGPFDDLDPEKLSGGLGVCPWKQPKRAKRKFRLARL